MKNNPILKTDSYKFSHYLQYPVGATNVSSYIEARGTKIEGVTETIFAGLQIYIDEVLSQRVTAQHVREAKEFCAKHGTPFNEDGWNIIVNDHNGYLPIEIKAVPEGSPVPLQNVLVQVQTNEYRLPWLTSYVETVMLSYVWYASTVATMSREIKKTIKKYLDLTSDNPDAELPFKLHDFGYRGVSPGSADVGGFAHLINFMGTDTVAGITCAMEHYNSDVCGFSIPASEHSTMTSWGRENEYAAYKNMVDAYAKPGAIFACVIDSYDTMNAVRLWCTPRVVDGEIVAPSLVDQVKAAGATVVLRPDSGDPVVMPVLVIEEIAKYIGFETNAKGFSVLPSHVRVIQGDGIDKDDISKILQELYARKISASNIAFGMGGGLLQKVNRDTFKFAMKANAIEMNSRWIDVVKDPVTDSGKKSKAGQQILLRNQDGEYKTLHIGKESDAMRKNGWYPVMRTVYNSHGGQITIRRYTMDEVRKNAELK